MRLHACCRAHPLAFLKSLSSTPPGSQDRPFAQRARPFRTDRRLASVLSNLHIHGDRQTITRIPLNRASQQNPLRPASSVSSALKDVPFAEGNARVSPRSVNQMARIE